MSERLNDQIDVLGDVLQTLSFRGSIFFQSELAAPWGMTLGPVGVPQFHVALSGECFIGGEGMDTVKVEDMDIIMMPNGHSHWIADQPGRKLVASENARDACELGNPLFQSGEVTNRLLCGLVHFDKTSPHPILDSLPEVLHFPKLKPTEPVWMTVMLIDAEIRRSNSHLSQIVDRLTEVLFLQLLNHYVKENRQESGFLAALSDRRIHKALKLIHQEPGFDWSLSTLGDQVGMSRATLVRNFQNTVGVTPMAYIKNWRIMKAYNAIKNSSTPLEQIAESMGYSSTRTLTRAFERQYGCTPSEMRRS
ncbi:MAG: AraC family transcriptional regulator [Motiliproteus sp.]